MRLARFENRAEAGALLAEDLKAVPLKEPLVLAIPRGGIEVAAPIAAALGAELDVVLARKLRAPHQPELALGAVSESGDMYVDDHGGEISEELGAYLRLERDRQMEEIQRRKRLVRSVRPPATVAGRTVILTDDGIATGSTMIAAIRAVRAAGAHEVIVAVPVGSGDRLEEIRPLCDRLVCLHEPEDFWAIGPFYRDFAQVSDERVVELLARFGRPEQCEAQDSAEASPA